MKKAILLSLLVFLLSIGTLLLWLKPGTGEILDVWPDMLEGKPFNQAVFWMQWVLVFQLAFIAFIAGLDTRESSLADHVIGSVWMRAAGGGSRSGRKVQDGSLGKMEPLPAHELAGLRHMHSLENGPGVLRTESWKDELDQAIGRSASAGCDSPPAVETPSTGNSSWLVMEIEEAAGYPDASISLSRNIEELVSEQDNAIYGSPSKEEVQQVKNLQDPFMHLVKAEDQTYGGEEEDAFSLKVVFRAESGSADSLPESVRDSWESKNDQAFYRSFTAALNE